MSNLWQTLKYSPWKKISFPTFCHHLKGSIRKFLQFLESILDQKVQSLTNSKIFSPEENILSYLLASPGTLVPFQWFGLVGYYKGLSIGLLICTLISENQSLEKSRSNSNRKKIQILQTLIFSGLAPWFLQVYSIKPVGCRLKACINEVVIF